MSFPHRAETGGRHLTPSVAVRYALRIVNDIAAILRTDVQRLSWVEYWWPAALLLRALAGCVYMARLTIATGRYNDFEMLYGSAVALSQGSDPYHHGDPLTDGNLNPPHVAALMLPVASLSIESAAIVG